MNYKYTCDCKSNPSAPVLKPVPVTDGLCDYCGYYAFLGQVKKGRVFIHSMYPGDKIIDNRTVVDEDFI